MWERPHLAGPGPREARQHSERLTADWTPNKVAISEYWSSLGTPDQPNRAQQSRAQPSNARPKRAQPSKDQHNRDLPSRDQLSRDQALKDQHNRDQPSRDQALKDQPIDHACITMTSWRTWLYAVGLLVVIYVNCSLFLPSWDSYGISLQFMTNDERSTWLMKRETLLRSSPATKLFLFAHMRGGSSVAGEMFNVDPGAVMWYEPGDAWFCHHYGLHQENLPQYDLFYANGSARPLDDRELSAMTEYYSQLLSCSPDQLPPEAMNHYFLGQSRAMDAYEACMAHRRRVTINQCAGFIKDLCSEGSVETSRANNCHVIIAATQTVMQQNASTTTVPGNKELVTRILKELASEVNVSGEIVRQFIQHQTCLKEMREDNSRCLDVAQKQCNTSTLNVVQVNRMKMADVEALIARTPDLYVIHYLRDPRAIALSRSKTVKLALKQGDAVAEAKFLCQRMAEDLQQRKRLEQKYPGVFLEAKYEDMVIDPSGFAEDIFSFINRTVPLRWAGYAASIMHDVSGLEHGFGVHVKNANETAYKWMTDIQTPELEEIQSFCMDYLRDVGYPIL